MKKNFFLKGKIKFAIILNYYIFEPTNTQNNMTEEDILKTRKSIIKIYRVWELLNLN